MSGNVTTRSAPLMGTIVTIQVFGGTLPEREAALDRAIAWFMRIENCCSRFDPHSEAMQLTTRVGTAIPVSPLLCEAVRFALAVAIESDGAFDPTVGYTMETRGFNREYTTGRQIHTCIDAVAETSYRDVLVDSESRTITLLRPLILDLGAVAKGLAIDMAARELEPLRNFAIDAGGDLYLGGRNAHGEAWSIGIRHPRHEDALIDTLRVSNRAVCTSGDYERRNAGEGDHHILDPRSGRPADAAASVTVVAESAMLADALATAAFVLGPEDGLRLLDRMGVEGLIITPSLDRFATRGMSSEYKLGASAILQHAEGTSDHHIGGSGGTLGAA